MNLKVKPKYSAANREDTTHDQSAMLPWNEDRARKGGRSNKWYGAWELTEEGRSTLGLIRIAVCQSFYRTWKLPGSLFRVACAPVFPTPYLSISEQALELFPPTFR